MIFIHLNYYKNGEFLNCMQIISLIVIFPYNPIDQIRIGICLFFNIKFLLNLRALITVNVE